MRPGCVRLAVSAAGICHSDVNVLDGSVGLGWDRPFTLGHEIAGTVVEVGPSADPSWLGAACVVYAPTGCMRCASCKQGAWNYCTARTPTSEAGLGLGGDGGLADQLVVDPSRLLRADGIDPLIGAVLTDAGLTAFHAVMQVRYQEPEATIVVIGIGGLGHLALQFLKHLSGAFLIAVDSRPEARDLATTSGADIFCTPDELSAVLGDTGRRDGVTAALDFVGIDATMSLAGSILVPDSDLVVVGSGGGTLMVGKAQPSLPRGLRVHLPSWGSLPELGRVLDLGRSRIIQPVVSPVPLEEVDAALELLRTGKALGRLVAQPGTALT